MIHRDIFNIDSISNNKYDKRHCYSFLQAQSESNWDSIQCYETVLNVTSNLIELFVPLTTKQKEVVSECKCHPQRSLMKRRSDAWKKIREDKNRFRTK